MRVPISLILIFLSLSLALSLIIRVLTLLVGLLTPYSKDSEKLTAYECGFIPLEEPRLRFDIHFYLVAILFIVFDLEIIILVPWAVNFHALGTEGILIAGAVVFILVLAFVYEFSEQALEFNVY